jgi:hypothetical protein
MLESRVTEERKFAILFAATILSVPSKTPLLSSNE